MAAISDGGSDSGSATDAGNGDGQQVDGAGGKDATAVVDAGTITPVLELGTNVTGKSTRKFYSPVVEGGKLNVELGPQGLWMVVLAFKTRGTLKPPLYLSGSISIADNDAAGKLALKKQTLLIGGDGFDYYYNFWLVVKNDTLPLPSAPAGVAGKTATITLEITDADKTKRVITRQVVLTGGP